VPLRAFARHSKLRRPTSALGQKQTSECVRAMSALPPKADIAEGDHHVRFVPKADIRRPLNDDVSPSAGDDSFDLRLLGLRHSKLVKCLLEIVEKGLPLRRRYHEMLV
jgi:hypothetical protein